jgi:hypothetical protein
MVKSLDCAHEKEVSKDRYSAVGSHVDWGRAISNAEGRYQGPNAEGRYQGPNAEGRYQGPKMRRASLL